MKKSNAAEDKRESELQAKIENCKKQLRELPETVDISDTDEYNEIQKQISEKESAMSKMNSASDIRNEYMDKLGCKNIDLAKASGSPSSWPNPCPGKREALRGR